MKGCFALNIPMIGFFIYPRPGPYLAISQDLDGDVIALGRDDLTAGEAFLLIRDPAGFLAIKSLQSLQQGLAVDPEVLELHVNTIRLHMIQM